MPRRLSALGEGDAAAAQAPKVWRKFRQRHGKAVLADTRGPKTRDPFSGFDIPGIVEYGKGEVIESSVDLLALNTPGMEPKFELLDGSGGSAPLDTMSDEAIESYLRERRERGLGASSPPPSSQKTLETMTQDELLALAAQEEINLKPGLSREQIIRAIQYNMSQAPQAGSHQSPQPSGPPQAGLKELPQGSTPPTAPGTQTAPHASTPSPESPPTQQGGKRR